MMAPLDNKSQLRGLRAPIFSFFFAISHLTMEQQLKTTSKKAHDAEELKTIDLGVFKLTLPVKSERWDPWDQMKHVTSALPLSRRLATEVYSLDPLLSCAYVALQFWKGVEAAVVLYFSTRLLRIIEIGLLNGSPDISAISMAVFARLACVVAAAVLNWASEQMLPRLKSRITTYFELYLMQANLRVDVPTSQEPRSSIEVTAQEAWFAFLDVVEFCVDTTRTISQLALLFQASREIGSPLFVFICILKPVYLASEKIGLWHIPHITYIDNAHKKRMRALNGMTAPGYRAEVLGGDLVKYILAEYKKAATLLGGVSDYWPVLQYLQTKTPVRELISELLGVFPVAYFSVQAILDPSKLSIAEVSILQQSSSMLEMALRRMIRNVRHFQAQCQELRNIYEVENIQNILDDGTVAYPGKDEKNSAGMSFELRNLSFTYSGSQTTKPSLTNVNLTIKPGQLVVFVGSNGSGKSTILKLLSRMYDPTSGPDSLLVDGLPISQYRIHDLRESTATLTQDHRLFPLSLGENIGVGNVDMVHNMDTITRAADMAGAIHCIEKLEHKFDTFLDPQNEAYGHRIPTENDHPLNVELEKLEKKKELSGGEKQRIVAARTFMRFTTGKVKYVAVDEPSSALDPDGELQLFDNLIKAREGKTMIFVTHRFAHLTKHADLIVCMRDGSVSESGTHSELMELDGEYAKLYNIQASAFVNDSDN
ncbi:P-loop containing nucleoside triphosphate hydrolase protein [Hymenopellis radicata]|nr:P-loop containing nucleoside triphosphate hydrolase protein [Hymenopellis radicata]